mmetsp:Transcript_78741/g.205409  ORF Transcript_78741/g.205409 Transcript_78741/m.205409 type:complete len:285 (-) Transcript_78741:123-977(-)
MKAPDWYRDAAGSGSLKPAPPGMVVGAPPPPPKASASSSSSRPPPSHPGQWRGMAPALPNVPVVPPATSSLLALPPPPVLALLPPPPPAPGTLGVVLAELPMLPLALMSPAGGGHGGSVALALGDHNDRHGKDHGGGKLAVRSGSQGKPLATVNAAPPPKDLNAQAFTIPGLQSRPFTEDELATAWEMMDLDGHGSLEVQDLRRTLELCGEEGATDAELQEMIRMLGKQGKDGKWRVKYDQFWRAFTNPPPLFRNWDLHRRDVETPPMSPKAPGYDSSGSDNGV